MRGVEMSFVPMSNYHQQEQNKLPVDQKKQAEIWERFFIQSNNSFSDEELKIRHEVYRSWERSKSYNEIHPLIEGSIKNIPDSDLQEIRKVNEVYRSADPILQNAQEEFKSIDHVIMFYDSNGIMVDSYGSPSLLRKIGDSVNAGSGACWSEDWAGTNGIGVSLIEKKPIQVVSAEHFSHRCHDWVCSAAPILEPFTGKVLGGVNVSSDVKSYHPFAMTKTIWLAQQIERFLLQDYVQMREMLFDVYMETMNKWKHQIIVLCDSEGTCIKSNQKIGFKELENFVKNELKQEQNERMKEKEKEIYLSGMQYLVRYKNIFWHNKLAGVIAVLEKGEGHRKGYKKKLSHRVKYSIHTLIGQSSHFKKIIHDIKVAASSHSTVLIEGDSGTGKEVVAQSIHEESSRSHYPFVALNCAAIPKELLPSELFGYVAGAFTGANPKGNIGKFELANKGTLFLDEIGDMPFELQVQLLRVLQEQEVIRLGDHTPISLNVRVIAATNKNLAEEVKNNRFRKDLFYRLNVLSIKLPKLKERVEDIPLLAEHFIQKMSVKIQKGPYHITEEAMELLKMYDWPGNIRELENAIEFAVNYSRDLQITRENLPPSILNQSGQMNLHLNNPAQQAELEWMLSVLKKTNLNITEASKELKMSRSTVYRKLKKYGYNMSNVKTILKDK